MFLHASVILSTEGRACVMHAPMPRMPPLTATHPPPCCRKKRAATVLCFEFRSLFRVYFWVLHTKEISATRYAHAPLRCKSPFFECVALFFGFQLEFHDVNLVKLWTGKPMNIHRSFVTTIWNQVMSLLSVKLSGTHLVSCTVMATWHRVLH